MASMFTDTHLSSAWKNNSQAFEESWRILYFFRKLLNSTPQFLSSVDFAGVYIYIEKQNGEDSSQVSVQARLCVRDKSNVQYNFRTGIDALHDCNVVQHRRVEITCEDENWRTHLPVVHLFVRRKDNRGHQLVPLKCEGLWGSHQKFQPKGWFQTVVADGLFSERDGRSWHFLIVISIKKALRVHIHVRF
jgi:hypothetical protein